MIDRRYLKCAVCKTKTAIRTRLTYAPYLEFAFPCGGCGVEIRFGIELHPPKKKYVKLINATWIRPHHSVSEVQVFDADHLVPVQDRLQSPFIAAVRALGDSVLKYYEAAGTRAAVAERVWPELQQAILHRDRQQWKLFDRQMKKLGRNDLVSQALRIRTLYDLIEEYGRVFRKDSDAPYKVIRQRIALVETVSKREAANIVDYFRINNKDADLEHQLVDIRRRWAGIYGVVAPIYASYYWNPKEHQLTQFTLPQKRFDELKTLYVDCFETLCRISVIAAGLEGIIAKGKAAVPTSNGKFSLQEFDLHPNGSKPDILKKLVPAVADLFVPFMDHRLRNGIGHHSARYDVVRDSIEYVINSKKTHQRLQIPYIVFCEKIVQSYCQIELVSLYVHWIRMFLD